MPVRHYNITPVSAPLALTSAKSPHDPRARMRVYACIHTCTYTCITKCQNGRPTGTNWCITEYWSNLQRVEIFSRTNSMRINEYNRLSTSRLTRLLFNDLIRSLDSIHCRHTWHCVFIWLYYGVVRCVVFRFIVNVRDGVFISLYYDFIRCVIVSTFIARVRDGVLSWLYYNVVRIVLHSPTQVNWLYWRKPLLQLQPYEPGVFVQVDVLRSHSSSSLAHSSTSAETHYHLDISRHYFIFFSCTLIFKFGVLSYYV